MHLEFDKWIKDPHVPIPPHRPGTEHIMDIFSPDIQRRSSLGGLFSQEAIANLR